jgi:integrase
MATFRKRGDKWYTEVSVNGKRKGKSFPTKAQARSWAMDMEEQMGDEEKGVNHSLTFRDLLERYSEEVSIKKKGAQWETIRLTAIGKMPIAKRRLISLKREDFEDWIETRLLTVSAGTVNRELNILSHCLTQARRWRLMAQNPLKDLKRPPEPKARVRRISEEEIEMITVALGFDESKPIRFSKHRVAVAFLFAIETGCRAGEICKLLTEDINLAQRTVYLRETKNGTDRSVPLSKRAVELLELLQPWPEGQPAFQLNNGTRDTTFRKAVESTGIDDLKFHDTRHEAVTRLAKKLPVLDLARAIGHTDIQELMTYYNNTAADMVSLLD